MTGRRAVLIAGPTASGKSALALRLAAEQDAIIVNADAMQVYDTLEVVTARPNAGDLALADHRLYGNVPAATRFSTGQWLSAAQATLDSATPDRPVIFVGGTGLYFDALINGFADIPQVPEAIAQDIAVEIAGLDAAGRMALLHREDSPWYPSLRLFRQQSRGAWEAVIAKVALELDRAARLRAQG